MPTKINYYVTKNMCDTIGQIALANPSQVPAAHLILMTGFHGSAVSIQQGFLVNDQFTGIQGIGVYDPAQLAVKVTIGNNCYDVIFPVNAASLCEGASQIIDRHRSKLTKWSEVHVVIPLERVNDDLPPMEEEDSLTILWEFRDIITNESTTHLKTLSERVKAEKPVFHGFAFYARHKDREDQLQEFIKEVGQNIAELFIK